jgi:hypothetical protein
MGRVTPSQRWLVDYFYLKTLVIPNSREARVRNLLFDWCSTLDEASG